MRKKLWLALISVLMSAVLFAGCSIPFLNGGDEGRDTIPFSEMEYERPDAEAIKARLAELTDLIAGAKNYKELLKYDEESSQLMQDFSAMRTLAMLHSYKDATDSYYEEEYRYCDEASVELYNQINKLNTAIVEGPYADNYREDVGDYVYESIVNDLLLNSDEVEPLKKERNQLNIDYNNDLATLTLTYEGQEYTMEDIIELAYSDGYSTYIKLATLYYKENAAAFTDYYSRMIDLDKQTAQKLGFASPADMYYLSFSRDYTPAQGLEFCKNSKEVFVPIAAPIEEAYYAEYNYAPAPLKLSRTLRNIPTALEKIDPELQEAWNHMTEFELYDYEPGANKQGGAFTTYISKYDAPFCFGNWSDDFHSTTTIVHEFGHYYDFWLRYNQSSVFNLDIAEVYSQGLEVLMQEHYGLLLQDEKDIDAARAASLYDFINPLTFQVALEDFQQRIYALDTFDNDMIATIYAEVLAEYGLSDYGYPDENGRDYSWFRVTHLFDAPFYTISYATSALVALQIWSASLDDYQAGVDLYMGLIHADQNQPFLELVQGSGFTNPFEKSTMTTVAQDMANFFGVSANSAALAA